MRIQYILSILFPFFLISCGTTNDAIINEIEEVQLPDAALPSKIVFLYFDIEKNSENKELITLTNTQAVDGQLKENTIINAAKKEGNLILQVLDSEKKVVEEQIIENPLNKNIEQYNESGEANTHTVNLQKSQFYMRFNQQNNTKSIKILKISSAGEVEVFHQNITL